LVNWYLCKTDNTNLVAGSDLEGVRWVLFEEVEELSGEIAKTLWPEEVKKIFQV